MGSPTSAASVMRLPILTMTHFDVRGHYHANRTQPTRSYGPARHFFWMLKHE